MKSEQLLEGLESLRDETWIQESKVRVNRKLKRGTKRLHLYVIGFSVAVAALALILWPSKMQPLNLDATYEQYDEAFYEGTEFPLEDIEVSEERDVDPLDEVLCELCERIFWRGNLDCR